MKTLKIEVPEGYEIDTKKSTFEEIVFKPVKKELPKSWEELKLIKGYWVDSGSRITKENSNHLCSDHHKNIFATESQAKASIALAQLSQLREVYRQGWKPDWYNADQIKHCIIRDGKIDRFMSYSFDYFLSFQSPEIRDEFLDNFKDLIEDASPLLFG